jgi:hypothetical protein
MERGCDQVVSNLVKGDIGNLELGIGVWNIGDDLAGIRRFCG